MDSSGLQFCLTSEEKDQFERNGYVIVPDALPAEKVSQLMGVADRVAAQYRSERGFAENQKINMMDFIGKDEAFLELLDWPKTFHKVWGILGWHIQLYHTHLIVTPAVAPDEHAGRERFGWHQDSGRLNLDMESNPRPRISLKVAFFLTDTSKVGCGNFYVLPGSHLKNSIDFPEDPHANPAGASPVCVPAGTAVLFDRRIWHAASPNYADHARKVLFYGYSYRWLKPRDDMTVGHYLERSDPIRKQLLGATSNGGYGFTSPQDEDVPLKTWICEHLGASALVP